MCSRNRPPQKASLIKAQLKGLDFEGWKKELLPTLKKRGWWGETEVTNPATGEVKKIFIGNRRLKTIFNTNMRVAYNQSRARAQYALEGDILLRYVAILDHRTRDSHKKMHGTLLSRWHNFWKLNYPPNGWNCRCLVNAYTRAEAKAKGWEETEDEFLPQGGIADKDWRYDTRNLEGEWAELDRVYYAKMGRLNQEAHAKIKPTIKRWLKEIHQERSCYGALRKDCLSLKARHDEEMKKALSQGEKKEKIPFPSDLPRKNLSLGALGKNLKKSLAASMPLEERSKFAAKEILLSHETIFTHFHHEEIEAIDYFMVRFHDGAYHMEPAEDEEGGVKGRPYHAVYFYKEGYFYRAVFKVTRDGKEVYLVSLTRGVEGKNFKAEYHTPRMKKRK